MSTSHPALLPCSCILLHLASPTSHSNPSLPCPRAQSALKLLCNPETRYASSFLDATYPTYQTVLWCRCRLFSPGLVWPPGSLCCVTTLFFLSFPASGLCMSEVRHTQPSRSSGISVSIAPSQEKLPFVIYVNPSSPHPGFISEVAFRGSPKMAGLTIEGQPT